VNGVHVAGVGIHPFGRHPDVTATDMGAHAVRAALADAGVGRGGFAAAFCGTAYGGIATGHRVLAALGLTGGPIVDIEAGCASGAAALSVAAGAIAAGQYDTVLVFGVEKMPAGFIRSSFFAPWQEAAGLTPAPAYFALRAQQLMVASGVTERDLADVVVKNRRHGAANPDAMFRSAVTAEEVLASRVVCAPLRLWMLCSPNEGAAAVVLRAGPGSPELRAAALRSHLPGYVLNEGTPMSGLIGADPPTPSRMAADAAYGEAGVGPEDLDVVECQDTDAARRLSRAPARGRHRSRRASTGQPERRAALQGGAPRRLGARAGGRTGPPAARRRRRPPGRRRPRRPRPHGGPGRQRQRRRAHPLSRA